MSAVLNPAELRLSDLQALAPQIEQAPTTPGYDREFEEMRHGATGNVELIGRVMDLPPVGRAPAWSFDLDCDGARLPGGRVNAYCASDAMHEVAKVLAMDELNGSGDCAGDVVVTLHRVKR